MLFNFLLGNLEIIISIHISRSLDERCGSPSIDSRPLENIEDYCLSLLQLFVKITQGGQGSVIK